MTGYTGTFKSLIALEIAHSITTRKNLFNDPQFKVNHTGTVLIFDEENSLTDLCDRWDEMRIPRNAPIHFISFQDIKIDEMESLKKIFATIEYYKPILIIFDSLVDIHSGNEQDASDMSPRMKVFRKITNEYNINIIVLHHHNKGKQSIRTLSRGSSDIIAKCDIEYSILYDEKIKEITFTTGKNRRKRMEPLKLKLENDNGKLCINYIGTAKEKTDDDLKKEIINFIDELRGNVTIKEIIGHLKMSSKKAYEIINSMKEGGIIYVSKTGKHNCNYYSLK